MDGIQPIQKRNIRLYSIATTGVSSLGPPILLIGGSLKGLQLFKQGSNITHLPIKCWTPKNKLLSQQLLVKPPIL